VLYNGTVRNDGVLEKRFEQRFPLVLALYKNPLLLLIFYTVCHFYVISNCICQDCKRKSHIFQAFKYLHIRTHFHKC
jgi:hypothetical protein